MELASVESLPILLTTLTLRCDHVLFVQSFSLSSKRRQRGSHPVRSGFRNPIAFIRGPDIVISEKNYRRRRRIMPESETIYAPCDGVIARLLSSKSAFSIRTALGLEVYVSFGIGSIELAGKGFSSES